MSTSKTRRLLLISYHFPPSSEVAGKPTARLVRYLPKFGWEPVVLTIPRSDVSVPLDTSGYADVVANTRIECVARWPYFGDALTAATSLWRSANRRRKKDEGVHSVLSSSDPPLRSRSTVANFIMSYCIFPDPWFGWVLPATRMARRLLRQEPFDAIMTVSPAHSSQMVGLALRRQRLRLPWVAQFHDPWYTDPSDVVVGHLRKHDRLQRWVVRKLEGKVVRNSDLVLLATDETKADFAKRYHDLDGERLGVLYNGYDPIDFPAAPMNNQQSDGPIRFLYTGALYGRRTPLPLFQGVADLIARGVIATDQIRIDLIGDCERAGGQSVRQLAAEAGLQNVVQVSPPISYPEALERVSRADVLLMFAQGQPKQIPAKLYDYLHTGRLILAYTDGATARVINDTGSGFVVGPNESSAAALESIVAAHQEGRLRTPTGAPRSSLAKYQAEPLAASLASHLTRLVEKRTGRVTVPLVLQ